MKHPRRKDTARRQRPLPMPSVLASTCPYIVTIDKQEKDAHDFSNIRDPITGQRMIVPTETIHIPAGDYSIRLRSDPLVVDWYDRVAVERKSMADLFASFMGDGREREERKLAKLNELEFAAYVVEGSIEDLLAYRCDFLPPATDQALRAQKMRNAIFKFQVSQFPRVHWIFDRQAEMATWRVLDWFYRNSLSKG